MIWYWYMFYITRHCSTRKLRWISIEANNEVFTQHFPDKSIWSGCPVHCPQWTEYEKVWNNRAYSSDLVESIVLQLVLITAIFGKKKSVQGSIGCTNPALVPILLTRGVFIKISLVNVLSNSKFIRKSRFQSQFLLIKGVFSLNLL